MPLLWTIFVRVTAIGLTWICAKLNVNSTGDLTIEATIVATFIATVFSFALEHWAPALWKKINPPAKGTP